MRLRSELRFIWPLTLLAVAAMAALVASLIVGAHQVDRYVRDHEQSLVSGATDLQIRTFEQALAAQTFGDDAMANLAQRFNPDWALANLPVHLRPLIGAWDYLVVDSADRAVWASHDATPQSAAAMAEFRRRAEPLIAKIRAGESARAAASAPLVLGYFEPRDGRAYEWMASLVRPGSGAAPGRSAMVIAGGFVTQANLAAVRDRYALNGLRIATDQAQIPADDARIAFPWLKPGPQQVTFAWTPERPGHELLQASVWIILGVVASFLALAALMVERTRRAARDLTSVHRTQAEFLANMSHEIRTPLNGVNALSAALIRTELAPSQRRMAETIHRSGLALQSLLTDFLDLARIDAGEMTISAEPFALDQAIAEVVDLMAAVAEPKGLQMSLDLDPRAHGCVVGDPARVKQVLAHLISNAIKFTDRGRIQVTVRPESEAAGETRWRFEVRDTGQGFDPAITERLFARFQQADGSATRRFGGSGLGLSICRELATRMGGALTGEGRPGEGAVFALVAPLPPQPGEIAAPRAIPAATAAEASPSPPLRVLVSEDHPVNRLVIETILSELGAEVVSTENGLAACDSFERQAFDMVLMDMQMPVMDGLTAVRRMRALERRRNQTPTPIVMVTANALPEHRAASLDAGAEAFITKPLDAAELIETINRLHAAAV